MLSPVSTLSLEECYDHCKKIALGHYENFPVGSMLVPQNLRRHVYALYAFMRTADDVADDPVTPSTKKLAALSEIRKALNTGSDDPIIRAVRNTLKQCSLDRVELHSLLDAFEFDARAEVRFEAFSDLRWYSARSAEPVGRMILALFGCADPVLIQKSNEITSALQLLNFMQDAQEDLHNGRSYFPRRDYEQFDIHSAVEILQKPDSSARLLAFEGQRVWQMIEAGLPLAESVRGRLRYELRAVILSALRLLRKMEKSHWSHLSQGEKPRLTRTDKLLILVRALLGPIKMARL